MVRRRQLTLRLLHKHHLGVREEVEARQEHHFAPGGRVAIHALLLHQGKLLSRALGCWRETHTHFNAVCEPT